MQESGEMYLESILVLGKEKETVRAVDVADYLEYSKPSVSRALGILKEEACICVDPSGFITLTERGRAIAEKIYERHSVLSELLVSLGVDAKTASEDACRIEHVISDRTFEAIKRHSSFQTK